MGLIFSASFFSLLPVLSNTPGTGRCYSRTCPFVREDGLLLLPFLSTGVWSSVSTMTFVAETLLQVQQ